MLPRAWFADFADVPASSAFHASIEQMVRDGITSGCGGGNYCPTSSITRAQMAVFLLRASHGSAYVPPPATGTIFADVGASDFAANWIEELYTEGITGGCATNPLRYCPNSSVTRGQMAAFLLKVYHGTTLCAAARAGRLRRRAELDAARAVDRGARAPGRDCRLRRDLVLPFQRRDARPDGGLHDEDLPPPRGDPVPGAGDLGPERLRRRRRSSARASSPGWPSSSRRRPRAIRPRSSRSGRPTRRPPATTSASATTTPPTRSRTASSLNALYGPDQLRQRVAWALHKIVVVSEETLPYPFQMAPYLRAIDLNAFGNYRDILYQETLNPAMGEFLNMDTSTKDDPNENYAREVMQLFSIGTELLNLDGTTQNDANGPLPTYDQAVIDEFKRVYTGWFVDQINCPAPNSRHAVRRLGRSDVLRLRPPRQRREDALRRIPRRPGDASGRADGQSGPEPGDRRHLQPPERRAVPGAGAHPQPRDLEPDARLRRAGRLLLQRRRDRDARKALADGQGDPARSGGPHRPDRPDLRAPARARPLRQQRAARLPRDVLRPIDVVRREPRALHPRHGPDRSGSRRRSSATTRSSTRRPPRRPESSAPSSAS